MQTECLNHKFVYDTPMQVGRLVAQVSDKAQQYTQVSDKRPYGVGLLVIGHDKTGPHLIQTLPSGNSFDYIAQAMGARSQGAKTYLEKVFETFTDMGKDELIKHALIALKSTSSTPLSAKSVTVAFVGKDTPFTILEDEKVRPYVVDVDDEGGVDDEKKNVAKTSLDLDRAPSLRSQVSGASAASPSRPAAAEAKEKEKEDEEGDVEM